MKPLQPTKRPELKAQESLQQLIGIIDDVKVFLIPSVLLIAIAYSFSVPLRIKLFQHLNDRDENNENMVSTTPPVTIVIA